VAIHQVFVVVLQIGELASYLTSKMETVDAVVSDALREVAVTIRERTCVDAVGNWTAWRNVHVDARVCVTSAHRRLISLPRAHDARE